MPKYTEGTWKAEYTSDAIEIRVVRDGELVAVVVETADGNAKGNAALIEHAPEMHESLHTIEAYLTEMIEHEATAHRRAAHALRFVRALLQKIRDSIPK